MTDSPILLGEPTGSLYTQAVREFIRTRDWPKGLVFDIFENDEPSPHLNIIFYRDNWLTLTFDQQQQVVTTVKGLMQKLWNDGIPIYTGKMESVHNGG